jgi:carbonic anhydrase
MLIHADFYKEIFVNNQKWVTEKLEENANYFEQLTEGQTPDFLYIGCSDSRVTAEELMGADLGQAFVHRNIANLVVPTDANINAVIQYAVEYLHIKYIIVCGHYECGGVKAALQPSDMGQLNNWLQTLRDVYRLHQDELDSLTTEKEQFDRLVELNVREQCLNIIKTDHVQKMWQKTGFPKVFGWVFDVRTGKLIDQNLDMPAVFSEISQIYTLKHKQAKKRD